MTNAATMTAGPAISCTCKDAHDTPTLECWKDALEQHQNNFLDIIEERWPLLPRWIARVLGRTTAEQGVRVSIAEMHRMYMRALQIELIQVATALQIEDKKEEATKLGPILTKYAQAARDYDYMTASSRTSYDLFVASYERFFDRKIIRNALGGPVSEEDRIASLKRTENGGTRTRFTASGPWERLEDGQRGVPIGGTRNSAIETLLWEAFWWKLGAAMVGAAFLVGPMWLLALKTQLHTQLGATTGFVFLFGFILAAFVEKVDQVFAGTLAYAAVLMVFVGVSIS